MAPGKYELLPTSDRSRASSPLPPYPDTPSSSTPAFPHYPDTPLPDYDTDDEQTHLDILSSSPLSSQQPQSQGDLEHSTFFHVNPRTRDTRECIRAFHADPRFNPPPPSPLARLGLIAVTVLLFYIAFAWRKAIWVDFGMGMGDHVEVVDPSY